MQLLQARILVFVTMRVRSSRNQPIRIARPGALEQLKDLIAAIQMIYTGPPEPASAAQNIAAGNEAAKTGPSCINAAF
jgi:hypothetical protein